MTDMAEERDREVEIFIDQAGSEVQTLSAHHISMKTADCSHKVRCNDVSEIRGAE